MPLPEYLRCESKYVTACDYITNKDCPRTCGFALDVGCLGAGGGDPGLAKRIGEILEDEQ